RDQDAGIDALGVVFGGSGNGEQISANKVRGIRAALVWSIATAELAREHNDANIISIGARQHTFDQVTTFIDRFIATPFSNEERHVRRIAQISAYEDEGELAPDPRSEPGQPDVLAADDSSFDPEAG
ncbi:MAG: RpiB/LacA/LacB family sugar-phosphate isomerase, partial [Microbacterium sp.]